MKFLITLLMLTVASVNAEEIVINKNISPLNTDILAELIEDKSEFLLGVDNISINKSRKLELGKRLNNLLYSRDEIKKDFYKISFTTRIDRKNAQVKDCKFTLEPENNIFVLHDCSLFGNKIKPILLRFEELGLSWL